VVCSANECRSPIVEHLLRRSVNAIGLPWQIRSAGTVARNGRPMNHRAAQILAARGITVASDWATHRLSERTIEDADLILTAEVGHRSTVVQMTSTAIPRTFPLLQFARMASRVDPITPSDGETAGPELLRQALAKRHLLQPVEPDVIEMVDPIGGRTRAFRRCADTALTAVDTIMAPLVIGSRTLGRKPTDRPGVGDDAGDPANDAERKRPMAG
jgi:protein-tyrosine phosphatase